jgi:hypothetical protein
MLQRSRPFRSNEESCGSVGSKATTFTPIFSFYLRISCLDDLKLEINLQSPLLGAENWLSHQLLKNDFTYLDTISVFVVRFELYETPRTNFTNVAGTVVFGIDCVS